VDAGHGEQARMLQIALAPAPVTDGEVDDRGRPFLIGADEIVGDAHAPTGAAEEGGLDEIVAEDMAAERRPAGEDRQAGRFGEGASADDGVVAPVIALAAAPPGKPGGNHRAIDAAGELLDAGEHGA